MCGTGVQDERGLGCKALDSEEKKNLEDWTSASRKGFSIAEAASNPAPAASRGGGMKDRRLTLSGENTLPCAAKGNQTKAHESEIGRFGNGWGRWHSVNIDAARGAE